MMHHAFATSHVISISTVCNDENSREYIHSSEYIRNETMKRCEAIPSYKYKSRKWKNKYYDMMKARVIAEMN